MADSGTIIGNVTTAGLTSGNLSTSASIQTNATTGAITLGLITTGAQGPQGVPGPAGSDAHYETTFTSQSTITVTHGLNKKPAVTVLDSAGDECVGEIQHLSNNQLTVTFSAPFSGIVTCN